MNQLTRTVAAMAAAFQEQGIECRELRKYLVDCVNGSEQFISVAGDSMNAIEKLRLENQISNCRILISILRTYELTS
jgi:hypothetical protein